MRRRACLKLAPIAVLVFCAVVIRGANADIYEDHLKSWQGGAQGLQPGAHACTAPTLPDQVANGEEMHNPIYVRMNPALFPG